SRRGRGFRRWNKNFLDSPFDSFFTDATDFSVDIKEKKDNYTLEADLPGIPKENIHLDYTDNIFSIDAHQETEQEEKDEEGNYIRRERTSRSYSRQFLLKNIDETNIEASFKNGVLTVDLPKKEKKASETNKIEIQ
ncbi:MAG: Hsp20/alpha crystallin family protein, partial [Atopostipes suicloacalis]|nr:Hsp20/alpha crystallin family protein [Atopostipes suicloacalis]